MTDHHSPEATAHWATSCGVSGAVLRAREVARRAGRVGLASEDELVDHVEHLLGRKGGEAAPALAAPAPAEGPPRTRRSAPFTVGMAFKVPSATRGRDPIASTWHAPPGRRPRQVPRHRICGRGGGGRRRRGPPAPGGPPTRSRCPTVARVSSRRWAGRPGSPRCPGPLGETIEAEWRLLAPVDGRGRTAVIEMSRASGRALLPHPQGDDPVDADTAGVGHLLLAARDAGRRRGSSSAVAGRPRPTAGWGAVAGRGLRHGPGRHRPRGRLRRHHSLRPRRPPSSDRRRVRHLSRSSF